MGAAGGSFGQSFAQTLIQGMLAQNQIQQSQADLKIKRDLADANLKQHMAQTADLERKTRAVTEFASKLRPQMIGGGLEGPQTMIPGGQPTQTDINQLLAQVDPGKLAAQYQPHYFDPTKGLSSFTPGTGQTNQVAAPQPPPMNQFAERALQSAFGGQPAAGASAAGLMEPGNIDLTKRPTVNNPDGSISTVRSMSFNEDGKEVLIPTISPDGRVLTPDQAVNLYHTTGQHLGKFDTPEAATQYAKQLSGQMGQQYGSGQSPLNPGGIRYEPPQITVDPKGGISLKTGPVKANVHIEKIEYPVGSGNYQSVAIAIDPTNPNNRQMIPLGKPLPSEQMQRFEAIAESWGIPPGEVRKWAVGAIADVTTTYTGPAQAIAMEDLKAKLQGAVGKGLGGTATKSGTVLERVQDLEAKGTAKNTAARIQATNQNEPPAAGEINKLTMLQSVERQMGLVEKNFDEKFVGKGFGQFSDKLRAEYDKQETLAKKGEYKGALAGNVRQFFGKITPEEVQFRSALLDASDLLLRARSGAQINEQEYQRLKAILPSLTDEPNVFLPAMKRFQKEVSGQITDTLELGSTSRRDLLNQRGGTKTAPSTAPKGFRPE